MSVEQIKSGIAALSPEEQTEVTAFLFQLRHADDDDYHAIIERRLSDKDPSHWLTPEESASSPSSTGWTTRLIP